MSFALTIRNHKTSHGRKEVRNEEELKNAILLSMEEGYELLENSVYDVLRNGIE